MPQEIAATLSRSTFALSMLRVFIQPMQSASATQAPVMEAVRVPPSAWITSQSMVIWRSPSASKSIAARSERPIRRWISTVRPPCLPAAASRRVRSRVARGSMPDSAVTQPRPWPLSQGGRRSSSVAVTSTWVSPNFTKHEPSAYLTIPRSSVTALSSSGCRLLGRIQNSVPVGTRVADLRFLHPWGKLTNARQIESGIKSIDSLVPLLPKFVSLGAAMYHELRKPGTRAERSFLEHFLENACPGRPVRSSLRLGPERTNLVD